MLLFCCVFFLQFKYCVRWMAKQPCANAQTYLRLSCSQITDVNLALFSSVNIYFSFIQNSKTIIDMLQ